MSGAVDIDLDALRAQRQEARGEPHTARLAGEVFELPPEFQFSWLEIYNADDGEALVRAVLGDAQAKEFLARATLDDIKAFATSTFPVYGIGRGESKASSSSSQGNGGSSRRTSGASTTSASRRRSGPKKSSSASVSSSG